MSSGRTLSARPSAKPAPAAADRQTSGSGSSSGRAAKGSAQSGVQGNLQDAFLNLLRRNKTPVTMFLVKGVKLQGIVTWFDNFSILLRRDGQSQLVYKHSISTIMPGMSMDAAQFEARGATRGKRQLQDVFLGRVSEAGVQVTMFLVNGVMLQGRIAAYDLFCMLLERDGAVQLAYKHAVSTIQPATPVDLQDDAEDDYDPDEDEEDDD
jgi:host factor-I protein